MLCASLTLTIDIPGVSFTMVLLTCFSQSPVELLIKSDLYLNKKYFSFDDTANARGGDISFIFRYKDINDGPLKVENKLLT